MQVTARIMRARGNVRGSLMACMCMMASACSPAIARESERRPPAVLQDSLRIRSPPPDYSYSHHRPGSHREDDIPGNVFGIISVPYIASNANVWGPVSSDVLAHLEAGEVGGNMHAATGSGASRGLLHGVHRLARFPRCNDCTMVRCFRSGYCSGHCRRGGRMRFCDSNSQGNASTIGDELGCSSSIPGVCNDDDLPATSIEEFDTVVVTVNAPFIGCADISNRPSACPARGTRATLSGDRQAVVLLSRCRAEQYVPDRESPLLPFGVCECIYREAAQPQNGTASGSPPRRRRIIRGACNTEELAAGSGIGGADVTPSVAMGGIVVQPSGDWTLTSFSNFTGAGQLPDFSYNVTATVRGTEVEASLDLYQAVVV